MEPARSSWLFALTLLIFPTGGELFAFQQAAEQELATIKGSLNVDTEKIGAVDWSLLQGSIGQLVTLQRPPLPDNWSSMAVEERQSWLTGFYESAEGKAIAAANQKLLDDRHIQEFRIRDAGKFVVYDVPQGNYELRIAGQTEADNKTWLLEAYGQFEVGEVDELDFSNMPVDVLRYLQPGEAAPDIAAATLDEESLNLSDFRGKHVLLSFGMTANPQFELTIKALQEVADATDATLFTVTVDEDLEQVRKFMEQHQVDWPSAHLGKWDPEVLDRYGLKSVPSFWLVDPSGKILLTGAQVFTELNRTGVTLAELVGQTMEGTWVVGETAGAEK